LAERGARLTTELLEACSCAFAPLVESERSYATGIGDLLLNLLQYIRIDYAGGVNARGSPGGKVIVVGGLDCDLRHVNFSGRASDGAADEFETASPLALRSSYSASDAFCGSGHCAALRSRLARELWGSHVRCKRFGQIDRIG
jgi:hypothetical protein